MKELMEEFGKIITTLIVEVSELKIKQECLIKAMKNISPELIEEANKIVDADQDELRAKYKKLYNLK